PMVLDFLTWPAMPPSGLRIAGTNLIAALRRMVPLGPQVSAGNAGYEAARSPARRMSYAQRRVSDTIRMCATMLTDFASREILDSSRLFSCPAESRHGSDRQPLGSLQTLRLTFGTKAKKRRGLSFTICRKTSSLAPAFFTLGTKTVSVFA